MKKKKHKGKKVLTAVGAIVAAGLTPGIIAASPAQGTNAGITAADVVVIDGKTYGYDELYDEQRPVNARSPKEPQVATRYGVRPSPRMYGVPRPIKPIVIEKQPSVDREVIQRSVLTYLIDYCSLLIDADKRGIMILPDNDLTHDLGLNDDDLKELKAVIEDRYGVEVSYHRFKLNGQLNTLRLVSEYIVKLKTVWE